MNRLRERLALWADRPWKRWLLVAADILIFLGLSVGIRVGAHALFSSEEAYHPPHVTIPNFTISKGCIDIDADLEKLAEEMTGSTAPTTTTVAPTPTTKCNS